MLRTILSAMFVFALVSFVSGEEKKADKKGTAAHGKFVSYKDGTLTLSVGKKGAEADKAFKVGDDVKVTVWDGENKKEVKAKEAFATAPTAAVTVMSDADGKVTAVTVGHKPKAK